MFSFRKIINTLVLISYVKMTIVSSFAQDSTQLPSVTTKLKVTPTFYENGELDHVSLQLIEKDRLAKTKTVLDSTAVYNPNHRQELAPLPRDFMNWLGTKNSIDGFKWDLKGYGLVKIDFKGSIILDGAQQLDPQRAFKISTVSPILLQNCTYHHLRTKSKLVMLMGGNTLHNLITQITDIGGGVLIYKQGQADTLGHISLSQGSLVNAATPTVMDGAVWDIGGGTFSNQDQLNLQGQHHVLNANLVQNDAAITGGDLTLDAKDIINSSDVDLKSLKATTTGSFVNTKKIQTQADLGLYIHGEGVNSGTLSSKGSVFINSSHESAFVNDGEIDGNTVTANNINNNGDIKSARGMSLGKGENHGVIKDETDFIMIMDHFANYSTLAAPMIFGEGHLYSSGICTTNILAIRNFYEMGGTLSGNKLTLNPSVINLSTCPKTKIIADDITFEHSNYNGQTTLRGSLKAKNFTTKRSLNIEANVDVDTFRPTDSIITIAKEGRVKAKNTFLDQVKTYSHGIVDFGNLSFISSFVHNTGTFLFVLQFLDYASPIYAFINDGIMVTQTAHATAEKNVDWWLSHRLNNKKGTLRIQGNYIAPKAANDQIRAWNGKIIVEDTMVLRASTELMNPALFSNFTVNKLVIDGQGGNYSGLAGSQDWTFAQHNIFQNFKQLWFFRTLLRVNNPQFTDIGSLISDGNMHVATGDLVTRNIGQFRMGAANDHLGKVYIADGGADMEVDGPADIRYGQIEMKKDGRICSLKDNVLIGEEGGKSASKPAVMNSNRLDNPNYTQPYLNGAFVKSHGKLTLAAPNADILVKYGQVLSALGLELIAKDLIKNLSGVIFSYGDIILKAKRYLQTRPDLRLFTARSPSGNYTNLKYYLEQGDPASLDTLGSLHCYLDSFENKYSDVLIAKSLFWNGVEHLITKIPPALKIESRGTYYTETEGGWRSLYHRDRTPVTIATMKIGEELFMNGGVVKVTGSLSGAKISLNLNEFLAQNIAGYHGPRIYENTLEFDITQMMRSLENDPRAAQFNLGRSCLLEDGDANESDADAENFHELSNPDSFIYKFMTDIIGKAYLTKADGSLVSGKEMLKFLAENGRKLMSDFRDRVSALVWGYRQNQEDTSRRERYLKLFISPDDVNPHQGSGDVTGDKIHIKTTGDQTHSGNTVHANTTTVLESESDFTGQSAQISGDDGVGVKAKNLRAETLAQRIYTNNGFYSQQHIKQL